MVITCCSQIEWSLPHLSAANSVYTLNRPLIFDGLPRVIKVTGEIKTFPITGAGFRSLLGLLLISPLAFHSESAPKPLTISVAFPSPIASLLAKTGARRSQRKKSNSTPFPKPRFPTNAGREAKTRAPRRPRKWAKVRVGLGYAPRDNSSFFGGEGHSRPPAC